jgi:hypothetical protein
VTTTPIRALIAAVARSLSVSRAEVCSSKRNGPLVLAREAVALVLLEHYRPKPSLTDIGIALGGRHHTAVISMLARAKKHREDEGFRFAFEAGLAALHIARQDATGISLLAKCARRDAMRAQLAELDGEIEGLRRAVPGAVAAE